MAKVRIYEIANELKIQSKDVIEFLKEKNIFKKTASSSIEDDVPAAVWQSACMPRGRKKKQRLRQGQPPSQQRRKTEQPRQSPPKGMRPRLEKVRRDRQKEGELS